MKIKGKDFKIIGHRGVAALEPENTLLSIKKALNLGCEMIEVDARLSKDGEVVLIHDSTLNRTTNGKGRVTEKTLNELKTLDILKGEKIPTLKEAWNLVKGKADLNIEVKEKLALEKVVLFIKKENIEDKVLVSFTRPWALAKMKRSNPSLRIALVSYLPFCAVWQAKKIKAESLHSLFFITNNRLIKKAKQKNLKIYPFPYGSKKEKLEKIKNLVNLGIDGIFLNDPTVISKI